MTNSNPAAESARENARQTDGKFGVQPASEADLELTDGMTLEQTVRARDTLGLCLADAQERGEDDFELSAAYQRATVRMVGTALGEYRQEVGELAFVPHEDGGWRLDQASTYGGNPVDVGHMVPGTNTTWEEVGDSLLLERDGNHIAEAVTCLEDGLMVIDTTLAESLAEEDPEPHPRIREAFIAWQKASQASHAIHIAIDPSKFETTPEYTRLVQTVQRNTVKAAAIMLAQEKPEARYLVISDNVDGEAQYEVDELRGADGEAIARSWDAGEIKLGGGSLDLNSVGYAFVNRDGSWIGDVAEHDVHGFDTRVITIDLAAAAAMDVEKVPERIAPVSDHDEEIDWDEVTWDDLDEDDNNPDGF